MKQEEETGFLIVKSSAIPIENHCYKKHIAGRQGSPSYSALAHAYVVNYAATALHWKYLSGGITLG